ncbi:protein tyrosine phosphatase [Pendulispora rubella]|uniref:protein-tyrosine-phosphatase n=1 Tax=Pendulispora rubella TaxID=2741070 RepID=A0ABZ2LEU9_9BACT
MRDFIDLHSHWIAHIDDGARSPAASVAMLSRLFQAGFSTVIATPHMRPGMFDNDRPALERAYAAMGPHLEEASVPLPKVGLASEHFFDDVVFQRLVSGEGVPYPSVPNAPNAPHPPGVRRAVLVELPSSAFPRNLQARFFDLRRAGLAPVLAHPERYQPVWKDIGALTPLLDAGTHLQLDLCSLVGKYGRAAQRAAEELLEEEAYEIASSDAHKPEDVDAVVSSIERLEALVGRAERSRLLIEGPRSLLSL